MKFSVTFYFLGHSYMLKIHSMKTPTEPVVGYSSRIGRSNNHVLVLDYDLVDELTLKEELEALIEEFKLGTFYVLSSREEAYHCVCLNYFRLLEVKTIAQASSCDLGFVIAPRYDKFRNFVLRASGKGDRDRPRYAFTVKSPYNSNRLQSTAHANFLTSMGVPISPLENPDGLTELKVETYLTASRTKVKGNK